MKPWEDNAKVVLELVRRSNVSRSKAAAPTE